MHPLHIHPIYISFTLQYFGMLKIFLSLLQNVIKSKQFELCFGPQIYYTKILCPELINKNIIFSQHNTLFYSSSPINLLINLFYSHSFLSLQFTLFMQYLYSKILLLKMQHKPFLTNFTYIHQQEWLALLNNKNGHHNVYGIVNKFTQDQFLYDKVFSHSWQMYEILRSRASYVIQHTPQILLANHQINQNSIEMFVQTASFGL